MEPAVLATGLNMHYDRVHAVRDVDLSARYGEIVGLLGPNGAGKTTTLRMIATLLTPTSGEVTVGGISTVADPMAVRRQVGYLTGDTGLYGRLTPRELLLYFGRLHEVPAQTLKRRVDQLIADLQVGEFHDRRCDTLSTGQKQRVNIARTLIHDPTVLIVDEPTSGLDIISAQFILKFLARERERGKAIILSTHIMTEAELLCDRLLLIHKGEIMASGTLVQLLEGASAPNLTEAFLATIARHEAGAANAA